MVADVVAETHDTATLVFFTGNDRLDYKAGHFLTIDPHQFEALERFTAFLEDLKGKKEPPRAYSMVSAPHERYLAVTVKEERYASGQTKYPPLLSPLLVKHMVRGMRLAVTGFTGPYTLPDDIESKTDHLVHLCAGSGSVPNVSILKHALEFHARLRHTFIYSNKTWDDVIFREHPGSPRGRGTRSGCGSCTALTREKDPAAPRARCAPAGCRRPCSASSFPTPRRASSTLAAPPSPPGTAWPPGSGHRARARASWRPCSRPSGDRRAERAHQARVVRIGLGGSHCREERLELARVEPALATDSRAEVEAEGADFRDGLGHVLRPQATREEERYRSRLADPPADRPVVSATRPPSSFTASPWLPESRSRASTPEAAARASSTDSGPATCTTCTMPMPGRAARRSRCEPRFRRSTSWTVVVRSRRCWVAIASVSWRLVSRKVATAGGVDAAISAMVSSAITPGPLGMADTRPSAEAPARMAVQASSRLAMQQTFTRGRRVGSMPPSFWNSSPGFAQLPCAASRSPTPPSEKQPFLTDSVPSPTLGPSTPPGPLPPKPAKSAGIIGFTSSVH